MSKGEDYLFHYTTRDAAFGDILPRRRLRFSLYKDMRDPLENRAWVFPAAGGVNRTTQQALEALKAFHRHANEIRVSARLLSLTLDAPYRDDHERRFAPGWSRARMWEQYAECHAGVCLVFRRSALTKAVVASLTEQGFAEPYYKPVSYSAADFADARRTLNLEGLLGRSSAPAVREWVEAHHDALFFAKAPDWRTEYEYRFVVTAPGDKPLYVEIGDALASVIVGEQFPAWQHVGAIAQCHEAGADFRRLSWWRGYPSLAPSGEIRPERGASQAS